METNLFRRSLCLLLAGALSLCAPAGAMAQVVAAAPLRAPVSVPVFAATVRTGDLAASTPGLSPTLTLSGAGIALPSGLVPTLRTGESAAKGSVVAALPLALPAAVVPGAIARPAFGAAAAPAAAAEEQPAAIQTLQETGTALSKDASGEKSSSILSRLFESSRARAFAEDAVPAAPSDASVTGLSAAGKTAASPSAPKPVPAPSVGWKEAFGIGSVLVALQLLMEYALPPLIGLLTGYTPHPNYLPPSAARTVEPVMHLVGALKAAVVAPVIEEFLIRAGLMGWLTKVLTPLSRHAPWIAALATSLLFVVGHETADPVFFAIRLAGSLMLSWAYMRGGLKSSIAMHGLHNGFYALQDLSNVFLGANSGNSMAMLLGLAYAFAAYKVWPAFRAHLKKTPPPPGV
ncbi:MAG: CPBP family intramembrane glutamic endopeptidase [Elusimicrobiota bacterium]|jgi:membrane protease YdiL (CAAX protease family)